MRITHREFDGSYQSCIHLDRAYPGGKNVWADLVSRSWGAEDSMLKTTMLQLGAFAVFLFLRDWNTKERGNQHGTITSKISAIYGGAIKRWWRDTNR